MGKRAGLSFDTQHRIFMHERAREVAAKEPELEPWQVAERFGIDEDTARKIVAAARERKRVSTDPVQVDARFGKLVVLIADLAKNDLAHPYDGAFCLVRCDCGVEKEVRSRHLRRGHLHSCGCASGDSIRLRMAADPAFAAAMREKMRRIQPLGVAARRRQAKAQVVTGTARRISA